MQGSESCRGFTLTASQLVELFKKTDPSQPPEAMYFEYEENGLRYGGTLFLMKEGDNGESQAREANSEIQN